MNTKQSKWMISLSAVVLLALSAAPALARFTEPGESGNLTRRIEQVQTERATESARTTESAQPVAPMSVFVPQPATVTVYAGPVVPAAAVEDRSGQPEAEKPEVETPEASSQVVVLPEPQDDAAQVKQAEVEHGPEVEFKGTVQSISGISPTLTLMVSGRVVTTTAQTAFLTPINTGDFIEVDGFLQADQSVWAKKLKLEDNPLVELEVEFRGRVTALPNDPNWLGQWVVGPYTITVDGSTELDTRRGLPAIGAIAEVKAYRQPDNSLLAARVKIEDEGEFQNEAEFKGTISNLTGSGPYSMTVAGHSVTTDAQTVIDGALANGLFVEVSGSVQANGTVLAARIHIEDPVADELQFTAHITALPANFIGTWTFDNGQTVTADANTLIDQSRGAAQVGALVEVKALKQAGNSWLAVRIQVEDN